MYMFICYAPMLEDDSRRESECLCLLEIHGVGLCIIHDVVYWFTCVCLTVYVLILVV